MPVIDRTIAEQAFRQAGFKRPFSDADFANAQKYGTKIFSRTTSSMKNPPVQKLDEVAQLQQQIDAAQGQYNATQRTQLGIPDLVRNSLGEKSPEFNLPREALEARYGNPQSPLYIQNPFVRQAVIEKAASSQQNAFTTVADKVNTALSTRALIEQQQLGGLKDKYGLLTTKQKAEADAKQQEFDNAIKLEQLAIDRQKANNTGDGTTPGDLLTAANYANLVATGQLTLAQVPAAVRGDVVNYVSQNGVELLPPKARESIGAINGARGVIDQIKAYSADVNKIVFNPGGIPKLLGGLSASISGSLGGRNAAAQASAALGDIKKSMAATLSRALGEKGVLTDYDIKRAQALIPTPYSTKQEAERKIKDLEKFFNTLEQRAYETATGTAGEIGLGSEPVSGTTSSGLTYTVSPN